MQKLILKEDKVLPSIKKNKSTANSPQIRLNQSPVLNFVSQRAQLLKESPNTRKLQEFIPTTIQEVLKKRTLINNQIPSIPQ